MESKNQGPIGAFTLAEEIERFQPGEAGSGRRAETLIKTDRLRVVLVTMRTGASLQEHTAPGRSRSMRCEAASRSRAAARPPTCPPARSSHSRATFATRCARKKTARSC